MVYFAMALALYADDDYEEVMARLAEPLAAWGCWDGEWEAPTSGGITQARARLGYEVLAEVFEQVAVPVATELTRGAWLGLRREDQRTAGESQPLTPWRAQPGELADALALTADVAPLVRQRQGAQLDPWLERAAQRTLGVFRRFAQGLRDDYAAVKAGMTLPWSTGPVEGHINRLKMLKRQMFGRARLDLLSRRFLLAPRVQRPAPHPQAPAEARPAAA